MRKNLFYKCYFLLWAIAYLQPCEAQSSFQYKSALSDVRSAGFYKIVLPPKIVAKFKNDLNDIRILDENGNQVPYILKSAKQEFLEKNFLEFPILDINREADKQTHIIIQNKTGKTVDELLLVIKNTDAERTVTLSGSDDRKHWFVIKEQISLSNVFTPEGDRFLQLLKFPNSSYKFFELIINGKDLLPVNIVKVGLYEGVLRDAEFVNIPTPSIIQKDSSDKSSYIRIAFDENYLINKLQIDTRGPKFFRRRLMIRNDKGFDYPLNDYLIISGIDNSYTTDIKAKMITLIIENQDNPPLQIQSVKAYQVNKYLLAYLESPHTYELVFGDSTAIAPKYDLYFFKDSLNKTISEIGTGAITKIDSGTVGPKKAGSRNMIALWIVIIGVLALLLILTFRMTKELAKKDDKGGSE